MKNVEEAVLRAVDQLPALTRSLAELVTGMNALLDEVTQRGLPDKAATTLEGIGRLVAAAQEKLDRVPAAELSRDLSASLKAATGALASLERTLARLDGDQGLLSTLQRTSESVAAVAGPRLSKNLEQTGRELREAAGAVRLLAEALQRDPDMLLKGKTRVDR
jgi:paraquat-inducible protein B